MVEPADGEDPALAKMGMAVSREASACVRKNSHATAPELRGLEGSWRDFGDWEGVLCGGTNVLPGCSHRHDRNSWPRKPLGMGLMMT